MAPRHVEVLNGAEEENEADLLRENKKGERIKQNEGCYRPSTSMIETSLSSPPSSPVYPPHTQDAETVFIKGKGGQKLKINYVRSLAHRARTAACQTRRGGGGGQWDGMQERETEAQMEVRRAEGRRTSGWMGE